MQFQGRGIRIEWHCTFNCVLLHTTVSHCRPIKALLSGRVSIESIVFYFRVHLGWVSIKDLCFLIEVPHSTAIISLLGAAAISLLMLQKICHFRVWAKEQSAVFIYSLFLPASFKWFPSSPGLALSPLPLLPRQPLIDNCISIYWSWWSNHALPLLGTISWTQTMTGQLRNLWHSSAARGGRTGEGISCSTS